jgi:hypothetical protein
VDGNLNYWSLFSFISLLAAIMAIEDSDENARVFGRPGSRPITQEAFTKVRLVILVEAGHI